MTTAAEAIQQRNREERRRAEVFRKGRVSSLAVGASPPLYQIDGGRWMPLVTGAVDLVVGDIVVWVDQSDPFVVGKFAGT